MQILAIETSGRPGGVAILRDGRLCGEVSVDVRKTYCQTLLYYIDWLLSSLSLSYDDINLVAVSVGPGSFTGLRIGLSTAKAFAMPRGLPLIGIPTLDALAAQAHVGTGEQIVSLIRARRREAYGASYSVDNTGVHPVIPPCVVDPSNISSLFDSSQKVHLVADTDVLDMIRDWPAARELVKGAVPVHLGHLRAGTIASLAWERWLNAEDTCIDEDLFDVLPTYVRAPVKSSSADVPLVSSDLVDSVENGSSSEVSDFLRSRKRTGTFRSLSPIQRVVSTRIKSLDSSKELVDFSSNDYLGLLGDKRLSDVVCKASAVLGTGSGASRLMTGDLTIHHELERESASLVGKEAALLFGSGFMANIGVIPALVGRNDAVFADKFCHASIMDACLLSRARLFRFRHNDVEHLNWLLKSNRHLFKQALIVSESVFSMEGDISPIESLVSLSKEFSCRLMLDEAHAVGVIGDDGCGLVSQLGFEDDVDIILGTYGKAFSSYGAFVACDSELRSFLINRARSFIFSTAPAPPIVAASLEAMRISQEEKWRRTQVSILSDNLRKSLNNKGIKTIGETQIVPVLIGEETACSEIAADLEKRGLLVKAIRHPTVPKGMARLRISVCASHTEEDIQQLVDVLCSSLTTSND